MDYRNEWKHVISNADLISLRQRLRVVAKPDAYAGRDGRYSIRSLYFDTPSDKALREKVDGVNKRDKYRLRYYNADTGLLRLEKKSKLGGLCAKQGVCISAEEAERIINGDIDWMPGSKRALVAELYSKMRSEGLKPKTIVDYCREPFVYAPGNVRVTLDYNIRTSSCCRDFLNAESVTISAGEPVIILEVKWDEFLPSIIRDAVQLGSSRTTAFSKYQICRIYG